jgi:pectate lyase
VRFGRVHYYNNFLKDWNWCGVGVTMGGQLYSENNIYGGGRWNNSLPALLTEANKWSPKPGFVKSVNDRFLNLKNGIDSRGPGINTGKVFDPKKCYRYKADPPDDRLLKNLEKYAGWSADPKWPEDKPLKNKINMKKKNSCH